MTITIRGEAVSPPPLSREQFEAFAVQLADGQSLPLVRQLQLVQETLRALEDAERWRRHREQQAEGQKRYRERNPRPQPGRRPGRPRKEKP